MQVLTFLFFMLVFISSNAINNSNFKECYFIMLLQVPDLYEEQVNEAAKSLRESSLISRKAKEMHDEAITALKEVIANYGSTINNYAKFYVAIPNDPTHVIEVLNYKKTLCDYKALEKEFYDIVQNFKYEVSERRITVKENKENVTL